MPALGRATAAAQTESSRRRVMGGQAWAREHELQDVRRRVERQRGRPGAVGDPRRRSPCPPRQAFSTGSGSARSSGGRPMKSGGVGSSVVGAQLPVHAERARGTPSGRQFPPPRQRASAATWAGRRSSTFGRGTPHPRGAALRCAATRGHRGRRGVDSTAADLGSQRSFGAFCQARFGDARHAPEPAEWFGRDWIASTLGRVFPLVHERQLGYVCASRLPLHST